MGYVVRTMAQGAKDEQPVAEAEETSVPQDIRAVQTIKHESMFLLSDRYGDIVDGSPAALGLYFRDTRFLSRWELRIDGQRPLYLHSAADRNYSMLIETTLPREELDEHGRRKTENLQVSRQRRLGAGMHETIKLLNHGAVERNITVEIRFGADFLDVFEVRGVIRDARGKTREPDVVGGDATLAYDGRDGVVRTTRLTFHPAPTVLDGERAQWRLTVPPKSSVTLKVAALPSAGEAVPPDLELPPRASARPLEQTHPRLLEPLHQQGAADRVDGHAVGRLLDHARFGFAVASHLPHLPGVDRVNR